MSNTAESPRHRDPKPAAERIVQLAQRVLDGDILLPRFQRNFVWSRKQIIDLLDSVARNYPIGSVLLWQSRQELAHERKIADLEVSPARLDYPVNYLLDGQQRLSTICGALHWTPGDPRSVWNVAYDLKTEKFIHLDSTDEPSLHVVALRNLSKASTYFGRISSLDPHLQERARALFDRFTDYQVAVVTLGDMAIDDVAPVFERINSTGTRLTIVDLMRAATWSPSFDLVDNVDTISNTLKPKNFDGIDRKTLLRAIASTAGFGFSKNAIDELRTRSESELRDDIHSTSEAAKRAADYLHAQIHIPGDRALPYVNQFVMLCEIFRRIPNPSSSQHEAIARWFWRTTLGSYFGGWNTAQMSSDRDAVKDFAEGRTHDLVTSATTPTSSVWTRRDFRSNSATSKMLAIMLGHHAPLDLISGQKIDVAKALSWSNDKEFHHFFPVAYLKTCNFASSPNAIANIIMLTSVSNIAIRDKAPSRYLREIADRMGESALRDRLLSCMVPENAYQAALVDDYDEFLRCRSDYLQAKALEMAGLSASGSDLAIDNDDQDEDPTDA